MNSYTLLSGETIEYAEPAPAVADFVARVRVAANDPTVSLSDLVETIYSDQNPLLDTKVLPGRPMVTKVVFANPIYHVLADQIGIKRAQLGLLDPVASRAAHTISVQDAASELGITPAAVRAAITTRRLAAVYDNGQWWVRPESVASYRVSNRGPKRAAPVVADVGGGVGGSLSVRIKGGTMKKRPGQSGRVFPSQWQEAVVRTTTKEGSVRVFLIEPTKDGSSERIQHAGKSIEGPFRIVKRINSLAAAKVAWEGAR